MRKILSMNSRGTVTLPKPMRQRLGLGLEGGQLLVEETPDGILLRPGAMMPVEIYTPERLAEFRRMDEELAPFAPALRASSKRRKSR